MSNDVPKFYVVINNNGNDLDSDDEGGYNQDECVTYICPFCGELDNMDGSYSYKTHPMFWCDGGCRFVYDKASKKRVDGDELLSKHPDFKGLTDKSVIYSYNCLLIKRASPAQCYDYKLYGDEKNGYYVCKNKDSIDEEYQIDWKKDMSVVVNSYNLTDAHERYPKLGFNHDGIYLFLLCVDKDGNDFQMCFWGD